MRPLVILIACMTSGVLPGWAAQAKERGGDLATLEQAWKVCVREAFSHQPPGQSKAGSQRNALDECQEREDAYVKAVMAANIADDSEARLGVRTMTLRAREWVVSVAAYVVDPVSSWLAMLRR